MATFLRFFRPVFPLRHVKKRPKKCIFFCALFGGVQKKFAPLSPARPPKMTFFDKKRVFCRQNPVFFVIFRVFLKGKNPEKALYPPLKKGQKTRFLHLFFSKKPNKKPMTPQKPVFFCKNHFFCSSRYLPLISSVFDPKNTTFSRNLKMHFLGFPLKSLFRTPPTPKKVDFCDFRLF